MKQTTMMLTLAAAFVLAACQQSEIANKPAAEVAAAGSMTRPVAAATAATPVVKEKSAIEFVGAKVTRDHQGKFNSFDGSIEYAGQAPSRIAFDIDLGSIETDTPQLTDHLKTADFFDVATYPKASFVSTSIAPSAEAGATHVVTGVLDLHGTKKEVSFPVTAETTPDGLRARSEFTIDRHDWGISYRGMADDLIKDEVLIKLDLLFPAPPAA